MARDKEQKKKALESGLKREIIPLLSMYRDQFGVIQVKPHFDIGSEDAIILYGHLKIFLKKLEEDLLYDD